MYNVNPLREQRQEKLGINDTQYCLRARPGKGFSHRPMCKVIEMRGRYQGCGDFEGCNDPLQAVEVLLKYPRGLGTNNAEGTQKWHFGPISSSEWRPDMAVEFELTLEQRVDRLDAARKLYRGRLPERGPLTVTIPVLKHEMAAAGIDVYDVLEALLEDLHCAPHTVTELPRGFDITITKLG